MAELVQNFVDGFRSRVEAMPTRSSSTAAADDGGSFDMVMRGGESRVKMASRSTLRAIAPLIRRRSRAVGGVDDDRLPKHIGGGLPVPSMRAPRQVQGRSRRCR